MKIKIIFFSLLINCLLSTFAFSQELNCQVTVIVDNQIPVTSIEKEVFDILKQTVYEMMNNTKWTKEKYKLEERINCNIQIQISSIPSSGTYVGSIQVQSTRPAFNSSYNSTILNYQDDNLSFAFSRNSILIYSPNIKIFLLDLWNFSLYKDQHLSIFLKQTKGLIPKCTTLR